MPGGAEGGRFTSVDPAPLLLTDDVGLLEDTLLDPSQSLFGRMRAIFGLRALGGRDAIEALGRCLVEDGSALLRHECAYVMGQLQDPECVPHLKLALESDPSDMVRHEAAESLGNIATDECIALLERALESDPAVEVKDSCEIALENIRYLRNPLRI